MNSTVAVLLTQDALTNGAIYALLAMTLVMVFSVTRVILIPQGEIVSLAALTLAAIEMSHLPGTVWLLLGGGVVAAAMELWTFARRGERRALRMAAAYLLVPAAIAALAWALVPHELTIWGRMALALLIVVPLSQLMYRIAYRPLVNASVLLLLIVSMAIHLVLMGFGLMVFGAEGVRTQAIIPGMVKLFGYNLRAQALVVMVISAVLIVAMALFFSRTLTGKALRATAFNRTGARLVGIRTEASGQIAFLVAGLIGAISGLLIAPMTTIYFDTGFLIGLKGFIAAIMGGLASYPLAAAGAVLLGFIESYSSFWLSSYKEVIVFALIIPVLLWRNLTHVEHEEDEE